MKNIKNRNLFFCLPIFSIFLHSRPVATVYLVVGDTRRLSGLDSRCPVLPTCLIYPFVSDAGYCPTRSCVLSGFGSYPVSDILGSYDKETSGVSGGNQIGNLTS